MTALSMIAGILTEHTARVNETPGYTFACVYCHATAPADDACPGLDGRPHVWRSFPICEQCGGAGGGPCDRDGQADACPECEGSGLQGLL